MGTQAARTPQNHLAFRHARSTGKTDIVTVHATRGNLLVGVISWHGAWRKYCFFPADATLYDAGCLGQIKAELERMTTEHRARIKLRSAQAPGTV